MKRSSVAAREVVDLETGVGTDDHEALRLWLRILTCTNLIERRVKHGLRTEFATTLPRFDLMAQLARHPEGLKMGELSRRLMVSGGNVTGLTDALVAEGLVARRATPGDRRACSVRLTRAGVAEFSAMARAHERWVIALFSCLSRPERQKLHRLLARLKAGVATAPPPAAAEEQPA